MRREWSSWIKARQWSEFEKLAKVDPSQGLADTVAELELGFPDKPDRRALRKVLYLLSQAGFEPREIEEFAAGMNAVIEPIQAAFMVSADGAGDSVITYGREEKNRVLWLVAHVHPRLGVTRAVEDATTLDEAHTRLIRLRNMVPTPYISAEISVEYALGRLAQSVQITKHMPPVMAYWRASLPASVPNSHPADSIKADNLTEEGLIEFVRTYEPFYGWRLEMGALAPSLKKLAEEIPDADGDPDGSKWKKVLEEAKVDQFTPDVINEHLIRLNDLAFLLQVRRDSNASKVKAIVESLERNGSASSYVEWIVTRSMAFYVHTMASAREQDKGRK